MIACALLTAASLPFELRRLVLLFRNVGGELHHLCGFPAAFRIGLYTA
jgi:hypothetical protein